MLTVMLQHTLQLDPCCCRAKANWWYGSPWRFCGKDRAQALPERLAVCTCVCRHDCRGCGQNCTTLTSPSQCTSAASLSNISLQVNLQEKLRSLRVVGEDASRVAITVPPSLRQINTSMRTGSLTLQEGIVYEVRSCCTEGQDLSTNPCIFLNQRGVHSCNLLFQYCRDILQQH